MQRYSNTIINLDKTIELSRHIMNGNIEPSSIFEINTFCGQMVSFNFRNFSTSCPTLPIEHIGLAQLVYENAVNQFTTTKICENGLQATSFEQLPQGQHIADVLSICDPDALAWYRDKETGKPLQLDTSTGLVRHINKDKYEKFVEKARPERPNITHDDRFYAISNALYESICTYERGLIDNGCAEQKGAITSMILEEVPALSEGLLYLAEQTTAIYGNGGAISTKADVPIVKTADDTPTEDSAQE